MDPNSSSPPSQASHAGHSFWHFVSMGLGCLFGFCALILGAGFIYGGIIGSGSPAAAPQGQAASSGGGATTAIPSPAGTPSMENGKASITIHPGAANPMTYDTTSFTVKSGQPVKITLMNDSAVPLQHNLCVCKPGSKDAVMAEALKIMTDPAGLSKGFIPDTPNILWHTKLVNPKESDTIEFTPPAPGEYPYLCTFPGHSMLMNGVMKVE